MLLPSSKPTNKGYATMKESNVVELSGRVEAGDALTEMLRSGAQALIRQAVDAELQELLASHAGRVTDAGRAAVVRNGYLPERQLQTGIGPVTVKVPKGCRYPSR
jgi:transposase-like protein